MYLKSIIIENHKSFFKETQIDFQNGFNILIGKNNSGKSAIIEILSFEWEHTPHISLQSKRHDHSVHSPKSKISGILTVSRQEVIDFHEQILHTSQITLHASRRGLQHHVNVYPKTLLEFQNFFQENDSFDILFSLSKKDQFEGTLFKRNLSAPNFHITGEISNENFTAFEEQPGQIQIELTFPTNLLIHFYEKQIFTLIADRLNVGVCSPGDSIILNKDASNLPEVLHTLANSKPGKYKKLLELFKLLFPDVQSVITEINSDKTLETFIWYIDPETDRDDLKIPLTNCGSGLGQALAILYVIKCHANPMTIVIDEPQTFLHPGAIKKLIHILEDSPHQSIVATHSPTIITSADNPTILTLDKEDHETKVITIDKGKTKIIRELLEKLGAQLSDTFGADYILWVEGKTEKRCFPKILINSEIKELIRGILWSAIINTGDLEISKRNREKLVDLTFRLYDEVCGGNRLVPKALGYILDDEDKTVELKDKIIRQSKERTYFLERRMYENYIIHSEAIARVLNEIIINENSELGEVNKEDIQNWLDENHGNEEYYIDRSRFTNSFE